MPRAGEFEPLGTLVFLQGVLAVLVVAFMFSHADMYISEVRSGPKPVHWVLVVTAAGVGLMLARANRPMAVLRSPVVAWAGFYLAITLVWYVYAKQSSGLANETVTQAVIDRFRSMALLVSLLVVFADPLARRAGYVSLAVTTVFISILNILESMGVIVFQDHYQRTIGRASGLYGNPNQAGQAIAFGLSLSVFAMPRPYRLPLLLVGAFGVAATFSRAAILCIVILVLFHAWRREISLWQTLSISLLVTVVLIVASGTLLGMLDSAGTLNQDNLERLAFTADDSGRAGVARASWQLFLDSPVFGNGVAIERTKFAIYSHNLYVSLAADHGVIGLTLLPALVMAIAFRNPLALPFATILLVIGLFSHNLLDDEYSLVSIALAAATGFATTGMVLPEREGAFPDASE